MSRLWIFLLLLAHWINSPVLSAKGGKKKHQVKNQSGPATPKEDAGSDRAPESPSESDFLADFAGKHRLWVITAPSHSDNYLRMMEKQIQESEGLNCRLAQLHYYSECHDGRQNPTYDFARRRHCGGYGLGNGKQTSPLP